MEAWVQDLILDLILLAFSIISFVHAFIMQDTKASYFLARADTYILPWVGILTLLSLLLIIRSVRKRSQEATAAILPKQVCVTLGIIVPYLLLINYLGFMISFTLFLFALPAFFTIETRGDTVKGKVLCKEIIVWLTITIITVFVVQYLFGSLLGVRLPEGFWAWPYEEAQRKRCG